MKYHKILNSSSPGGVTALSINPFTRRIMVYAEGTINYQTTFIFFHCIVICNKIFAISSVSFYNCFF
jgi:hypothetical protein